MQLLPVRSLRRVLLFVPLMVLAACSSDKGPTTINEPPVVTVTGVAEGTSYAGPVTIAFSADRGTFSATLDGQPVNSGVTVQTPGAHVLVVTARSNGVTTVKTVNFTIQGPPAAQGGMLIIRM